MSGDYAVKPEAAEGSEDAEAVGITPRMFKDVANKGHAEFASGSQQVCWCRNSHAAGGGGGGGIQTHTGRDMRDMTHTHTRNPF